MNEIRFSCPTCGQPIQCEPGHAGENVPCPGCATLIRVPPMAELVDVPGEEDDPFAMSPTAGPEKKVSYAPMPTGAEGKGQSSNGQNPSGSPGSPSPESAPEQKSGTTDATIHSLDVQCACPICQAKLQISIQAVSAEAPASAADREREIEARKGHQEVRSTEIKPRIDKILEVTDKMPGGAS